MSLTSQIRYAKALDSTATDGSGKTALAFGDITAKYLAHGGTLTSLTTETITTLGTYQAPTSNAHIRIKEIAAAAPTDGVYEVHFHDDQVVNTNKKIWLFLSATGAAFQLLEVDLLPYADLNATNAANLASAASNYSATRGLTGTAVPAAAADAPSGIPISDAGGLDLDAQVGTKINSILDDTGTAGVVVSPASIIRTSGSVHVDSDAAPGGTGTPDDPADTIANGKTIADANGVETLILHGATAHTLAATLEGYMLKSYDLQVSLDWGSRRVANEYENLHVTGIALATNTEHNHIRDCDVEDATLPAETHMVQCRTAGTLTIQTGTKVDIYQCSTSATAATTIDFGTDAGGRTVVIGDCVGNWLIDNLGFGGRADVLEISGNGRFELLSSCAGGTLRKSGAMIFTDSSGTPPTLTEDQAKDLLDTGNVGQIDGSSQAATNLKQSALALRVGAVATASGDANTATAFDTNLPTENANYYGDGNGGLVIAFVAGTSQQFLTRRVVASVTAGSNTRITLEAALDGTPTDADTFIVLGRITELS